MADTNVRRLDFTARLQTAFSHEEAVRMMREGRGKHFDPDILGAFLAIEEQCRAIACRYRDDGNGNRASLPIR